jgi:predicted amidophosphoribosyltransferase
MGILVLWLICAVVGALIGSAKGRVLAGFLWGLFLGPLGWLIIAVAGGSGKQCPACRSWIDKQASVCPKCGRDISQPPRQGQVPAVSATGFCPRCGAPRNKGSFCANCGKPLPA